jgi:hypothetical protein
LARTAIDTEPEVDTDVDTDVGTDVEVDEPRSGLLWPVASIVLVLGSVVVALLITRHHAASPPTGPPPTAVPGAFALGPGPVPAIVAFANGQGGCQGLPTNFARDVILTQTGAALRLVEPVARDTVTGTIQPDGTFDLHNSAEHYVAAFHGATASGFYQATDPRTSCTESYLVTIAPKRA